MATMKKRAVAVALSAVLLAMPAATASTLKKVNLGSPTQKIIERTSTRSPLGFQIFCLKNRTECRAGGKSSVSMDADLMGALKRVNMRVNSDISPRVDKGDVWAINVKYGDCEDYALTKRSKLISQGVSASALRIAYVKTRTGEGHAVLVVRADTGDFVLDNRTNKIWEWHQTRLNFISMSGANPQKWMAI